MNKQLGLTLVEILIAVGLAILVLGGGFYLYTNTSSEITDDIDSDIPTIDDEEQSPELTQTIYEEPTPIENGQTDYENEDYIVPPMIEWASKSLGNVSIKYPSHEYCGDSEVNFICLPAAGEGTDFHYAQWFYCDYPDLESDDCVFTCGNDFESCVVQKIADADKVISSRRFTVNGMDAFELEKESERWGRLKELVVDLGQGTGFFWLVQYNFTPALDEVYAGIISSIEIR